MANEARRNCGRVTGRVAEAWSETASRWSRAVRRTGGARQFTARVYLSGANSEESDLGFEGESTQVVRIGFTATLHVLNYINRPVQTRMPGGVGGGRSIRIGPYPDLTLNRFNHARGFYVL